MTPLNDYMVFRLIINMSYDMDQCGGKRYGVDWSLIYGYNIYMIFLNTK